MQESQAAEPMAALYEPGRQAAGVVPLSPVYPAKATQAVTVVDAESEVVLLGQRAQAADPEDALYVPETHAVGRTPSAPV